MQALGKTGLLRRAAWLFIPALLVVFLGALAIHQARTRQALAEVERNERTAVALTSRVLQYRVRGLAADLRYLARQGALADVLAAGSPERIRRLSQEYVEFARAQAVYDQIRWLDETGRERVRVNHTPTRTWVVPEEALQDKSERYYFRESVVLERGEVYFSPMDLNIEGRTLELPYKPMIRLATPVFGQDGHKRGVVVLNYLAQELLNRLESAANALRGDLLLLNAQGYYLRGPSREDEWGFMLGRDNALARRDPEAWDRVNRAMAGQFMHRGELWTFTTNYPLDEQAGTAGPPEGGHVPAPRHAAYFWKLVSVVHAADIEAQSHGQARDLALAMALVSALLLAAALRLAGSQMQRAEAVEALRESNASLERRVAERTEALAREVADRGAAEAEQRLLAEKYASVLQTTPDGFLLLDGEGRIVETNEAYCRMVGLPQDSLKGMALKALEDAEATAKGHTTTRVRARGSHVGETRHRRADGTWVDVEVSGSYVEEHDCYVVFVHDITIRKAALAALRDSEARFRALAEVAPVGIFRTDAAGRCVFVNSRWQETTGLSLAQAANDGWSTTLHPDDRERVLAAWNETVATDQPFELQYRFKHSGGLVTWVIGRASRSGDDGGFVGTITDISALKAIEARLRLSEEAFRTLVENVPCTVYRCQVESPWRVQHISAEVETLTGVPAASFLSGETVWAALVVPEDLAGLERAVTEAVAAHERYIVEYRIVRADGQVRWVHERGAAVYDDDGKPIHLDGMFLDITERHSVEAELQRLADTDPLTGVYNRGYFLRLMSREVQRSRRYGQPLGLVMLDLDHFKRVNDTHGHAAGDMVLKAVVGATRQAVRSQDVLARWGGEEFLILCIQSSLGEAEAVADRVAVALRALDLPPVGQVTASFGVTALRPDDTVQTFVERSDAALYLAKRSGRNRRKSLP